MLYCYEMVQSSKKTIRTVVTWNDIPYCTQTYTYCCNKMATQYTQKRVIIGKHLSDELVQSLELATDIVIWFNALHSNIYK